VTASGEYVSEYTKKTLEQFGWAAGDPIPQNMGDIFAKISERTPASKKPGVYVDADVMSADDVEAVKYALQLAKNGGNAKAGVPTDPGVNMHASTRALYAKLLTTPEQQETAPTGVQIIDDRKDAPEPEPAQAPPPEPQAVEEDKPVETAFPEQLPPAPPLAEPFCPRCNWDMRNKFEVEVTDLDKEAFVAITLGGERFKKTYELFDGKYIVCFRSMLAEENTEVHHQLLIDQKHGDFLSDTEWFLRFFEYRLACSIESITVKDKPIAVVPELSDVDGRELPNKSDVKTDARLVRLRNYVLADALKSEVTRRLVGNCFRQFQRLYETLEAMAAEPNFWKGIE
jgi:hypothetical protein